MLALCLLALADPPAAPAPAASSSDPRHPLDQLRELIKMEWQTIESTRTQREWRARRATHDGHVTGR